MLQCTPSTTIIKINKNREKKGREEGREEREEGRTISGL
jgi:hypothetical protein